MKLTCKNNCLIGAILLAGTSIGFSQGTPYHVKAPDLSNLDKIRDNCPTQFTTENINELKRKGSTYIVEKGKNGLFTLYSGRDNLPGRIIAGIRQAKAADNMGFLNSSIEPIDGKESIICAYMYKQKIIKLSTTRNTIGLPGRTANLPQTQ